jgi:microsomal dipeptidase-like Zn-dependent dipeptidase
MTWLLRGVTVLLLLLVLFLVFAPAQLEQSMNRVIEHEPQAIDAAARALHADLVIGDLHADSTLWARDLTERGSRGHVDLPRLREGNVALQAFTFVTRTPAGMNYDSNAPDARDNITLLALAQRWPPSTWSSLTARAVYQAGKLAAIEAENPEALRILRTRDDVEALMRARAGGSQVVGGLLGIEGAHALDDDLANLDVLADAGVRMFGLHHFFDNALGGSLHGIDGAGLTTFGRDVVKQVRDRSFLIDVAHSSEASVRDVLALTEQPVIVSHTGFQGHCATPRNISDELMLELAARGSLIGVGYWDAAVCDVFVSGIVSAIRYGIDLVGEDHVALGSDYDGSTEVPIDTSELAALTQEMLRTGFTETEIRKVMGGNMLRFLREQLPAAS